jgi:hypothetical protein
VVDTLLKTTTNYLQRILKHINQFLITVIVILFATSSCSKDTGSSVSTNDTESTYFSFYTPDWGARINCDLLNFDYTTTDVITSTSQSTNETMSLYLPQDSSKMVQPSNLKKYPIDGSNKPFSKKEWIPITKGSSAIMGCVYNNNITDSSYFNVTVINYHHSDVTGAYFKIKANFKSMMEVRYTTSPDSTKFVYGDFNILVKTRKQ